MHRSDSGLRFERVHQAIPQVSSLFTLKSCAKPLFTVILLLPMRLRHIQILTLLFATFLATGHCTVADILSNFFSAESKTASHCSEHHGKNKKTPGNHHSSCKDNGCCQPLLKTLEVGSAALVASNISYVCLPVDTYVLNFGLLADRVGLHLPFANAPPAFLRSDISSLHSAPNAPPLFS